MKSIFLAKFSKFIEWPKAKMKSDSFVIGIYGNNSYAGIIEKVYQTKNIKKKDVEIRYIDNLNEISSCHILVLNSDNTQSLSELTAIANRHSVLTILNDPTTDFNGTIITFFIGSNNTVGFSINQESMKESSLDINFMLVEIANSLNKGGSR
ncbi:MAG: YfiR family protein [Fibrobacterales bacterium]